MALQARLDRIIEAAQTHPRKPIRTGREPGGKRGPKQRHSRNIFPDRDMYVRVLEELWLDIEPHTGRWAPDGKSLAVPPDMGQIGNVLIRLRDDPTGFQSAATAGKLVERLDSLQVFLTTRTMRRYFSGDPKQARNRFGGDPRQIANAIAGVPLVGLWRSLKLCGATPHKCRVKMGKPAIPSYIRRKHPLFARALDANQGLPLLSSFVVRYTRHNDPAIRDLKAIDLEKLWSASRPTA